MKDRKTEMSLIK